MLARMGIPPAYCGFVIKSW